MLKIIVIITVMLFLNYCNCCDHTKDELLSAVALFRHGDKLPKVEYFNIYPNNPWSNPRLWNNSDLGSVTTKGKLNVYERGKWLRQRYQGFLPEKYSKKNIYVQASDSDRVLISAQLLLAGFYPPIGSDKWHSEFQWQPIPIHTVPDQDDAVVAQKADCPRFTKLLNKVLESDTHRFDVAKPLEQHTGQEIKTLENVYQLYKLFRIVEENGMILPKWARDAMPMLKERADLLSKTFSLTPEMQRFKAGPFIQVLLQHFDAIITNTTNEPLIMLFAGHSRSISNVLMALNSYEEQPPYSATLLFELKKNCNGSILMDIYYQTLAYGSPREIYKNLPYETFKEMLKPIAVDPNTWKNECTPFFSFL